MRGFNGSLTLKLSLTTRKFFFFFFIIWSNTTALTKPTREIETEYWTGLITGALPVLQSGMFVPFTN